MSLDNTRWRQTDGRRLFDNVHKVCRLTVKRTTYTVVRKKLTPVIFLNNFNKY